MSGLVRFTSAVLITDGSTFVVSRCTLTGVVAGWFFFVFAYHVTMTVTRASSFRLIGNVAQLTSTQLGAEMVWETNSGRLGIIPSP